MWMCTGLSYRSVPPPPNRPHFRELSGGLRECAPQRQSSSFVMSISSGEPSNLTYRPSLQNTTHHGAQARAHGPSEVQDTGRRESSRDTTGFDEVPRGRARRTEGRTS